MKRDRSLSQNLRFSRKLENKNPRSIFVPRGLRMVCLQIEYCLSNMRSSGLFLASAGCNILVNFGVFLYHYRNVKLLCTHIARLCRLVV